MIIFYSEREIWTSEYYIFLLIKLTFISNMKMPLAWWMMYSMMNLLHHLKSLSTKCLALAKRENMNCKQCFYLNYEQSINMQWLTCMQNRENWNLDMFGTFYCDLDLVEVGVKEGLNPEQNLQDMRMVNLALAEWNQRSWTQLQPMTSEK